MINYLYKTLQIDITYSVNSTLYSLKKLPFMKGLITEDTYNSKLIKRIIGGIGLLLSILRSITFKFIYFYGLIFICEKLFSKNSTNAFIHVYFFLTLLGLFINNKLLNTSTKKYFSLIVFQMDGDKFFKANLLWNILTSSLLNTFMLLFVVRFFLPDFLILQGIVLLIITIEARIIGECFNIIFYQKYHYLWYNNTKLYFTIMIILLGLSALPYWNIVLKMNNIQIISILLFGISIPCIIYLLKLKNYSLIYKRINYIVNPMNTKQEKDYLKQAMVDLKDKDKKINDNKLKNKKGYDLFNTIFFERHKEILLRSARNYALIFIVIYIVLGYIMINYPNYNQSIGHFLHVKLATFVLIMYFINRGSIVTQAMFYNCDHAMLRYNFYREPQVILGLFKKRLEIVAKVNLIPAIVIGIGNVFLLIISSENIALGTLITTFLFIISLSIFFSVHYLVIYYLLQPYNKQMEVKKISYSFVTLGTYIISYWISGIVLTSEVLSIIGLILVLFYIAIALLLVQKIAPRTFKLY